MQIYTVIERNLKDELAQQVKYTIPSRLADAQL